MEQSVCLPVRKKKDDKNKQACSGCGQVGAGHVRPWSKKCPKYEDYIASKNKKVTKQKRTEELPATDTTSVPNDSSEGAPNDNQLEDDADDATPAFTLEDQLKQDAYEQDLLDQVGFESEDDEFFDTVETAEGMVGSDDD